METYSFLRHVADSWGLLLMTVVFLGICLWAFRPGSRGTHDAIATSIFRNERAPVAEPPKPNSTEA